MHIGPRERLGRPHLHLRATASTNDRARALAQAGAPHGTLVTAGEQSAGRGRQGRTWSAPAGRALLMCVVLRDPPALLPLAAGVAVAEVSGDAAVVKWPNDVLLDGRKVAGILAEGRPQEGWAVLGIGVNVAVRLQDLPAELHATAAHARPDAGRPRSHPRAPAAALDHALSLDTAALLEAYRARDALRGHEVAGPAGPGRPRASTARDGWSSSSLTAGAPR